MALPLDEAGERRAVPRGRCGCCERRSASSTSSAAWPSSRATGSLDAQPMKIWLAASTDLPVLGQLFEQPWAPHAFSVAGAVFDLGVVPALLWRRTRPLAYAAVVAFHVITRAALPPRDVPVADDSGRPALLPARLAAETRELAAARAGASPRSTRTPRPRARARVGGPGARGGIPRGAVPRCRCGTCSIRASCCGRRRASASRGT